jgi:1-acyl-sn-glycerol-3-phosphate acyltransferase
LRAARLRLACLWLSQTARVLADNCVRMLVVLYVAHAGGRDAQAAWYLVTPFFILPFLLLAPLTGVLSNSWPKRTVLAASSAYCFLVIGYLPGLLAFAAEQSHPTPRPDAPVYGDPLLACLGLTLLMTGSAVFSATRYAILAAAADDTHWPLPRITGWIEMGGAAGVVLGLLWGVRAFHAPSHIWMLLHALNLFGFLVVLRVSFPSDVYRRESVGQAVADFFRDARRIFADPEARRPMLGLACFLALVYAGTGALLDYTGALFYEGPLSWALLFVGIGAALGSLLASWQGHPYRCLGLVPFGAIGMLLALGWAGVTEHLVGPSLILGIMSGLVNVPLRATYQRVVPADARGNAMAVSNALNYLCIITLLGLLFALGHFGVLEPPGRFWLVVALTALGAVLAGEAYFRPAFDQLLETAFSPIYRVHTYGPGLGAFPRQGPVLVIGNHTAWFDPFFIGKIIPRRLNCMMTSEFYDRPVVYWIFKYIFQAIRVQFSRYRREAPEIQEAVRVLDQGGGVALWPEGWLRRRPEPSLRKFGQGVWRILRERPTTPVVVCWVEGGYGSYTSYFKGKPTQNKRPDFWRRIDVAVAEPVVVPPDVLAEHRTTRAFLMRACLKARGLLGLEVPPLPEMADDKEDESEAE